jgi:hypothetical protein
LTELKIVSLPKRCDPPEILGGCFDLHFRLPILMSIARGASPFGGLRLYPLDLIRFVPAWEGEVWF